MTRPVPARRQPRNQTSRRLYRLGIVLLAAPAVALAVAGPAAADVPEGWSDPKGVDPLHAFFVVAGIPLLIALVIAAAVYLPALLRGERIVPGEPTPNNQWLGGPRRSAEELAGPDGENSQAGGAGARW